MKLRKRAALVPAIIIFFVALIIGGIMMIILDQWMQYSTSWATTGPYAVGYYSSNVLLFFQDVWTYMAVIIAIGVLGVWLYLRAQESSVQVD